MTGHDRRARGAILSVASATGCSTTLQCPVELLYPLESKAPHNVPEGDQLTLDEVKDKLSEGDAENYNLVNGGKIL